MWLCARLLISLMNVCGAIAVAVVVGSVGHSVLLPCYYTGSDPVEKLHVYWQLEAGETPITVADLGNEEDIHQDERYRGRTTLNPGALRNFTLRLSNLSLSDKGKYVCVVINSNGAVINPWTENVMLEVTEVESTKPQDRQHSAEFSTSVTKVVPGQEVTLTCTTHRGLHDPRVTWLNSTSGLPLDKAHVTYEVKKLEDTMNVANTVSFNVTSPTNITCSVENENGNVTSQMYVLQLDSSLDSRTSASSQVSKAVPVGIVTLLLFCAMAAGVFYLMRKPLCFKRYSGVLQTGDYESQ